MATTEQIEKEEAAKDKNDERETEKDLAIDEEPDGEVTLEDPAAAGDEEVDLEERPEMPHGAHVLHDFHDFYGAGHDLAGEHLKLLDNDRVKELVEDHADQLAAMAQELREAFAQEYPEHSENAPEEFGDADMEEESETPGEEFVEEHEGDPDKPKSEENEEEKDEYDEDEDDLDEKSRKSRKTKRTEDDEDEGHTEKSVTPAVLKSFERKQERMIELYEDEIEQLETQIAELQSAQATR